MWFQSFRTVGVTEVAFLGLLSLFIGDAKATVITNGCADVNSSCTLAELASGGSIIIDDTLFSDWFVDDASTLPVDIGGINVLPLDDQAMNSGVQFNANGNLSTTGFDLIDLGLRFSVATLDASVQLKSNSLEISGLNFGAGNVGGFINIFEDILDSNGVLVGDSSVVADNLPPPLFDLLDSADFTAQSLLFVEKMVLVSGGDPSDTVSLDAFSQRFSQVQVPEPSTAVLLTLGLLGAGFTRKRRPH